MATNEWKPLDGEPDLFKMFGRWDKRAGVESTSVGSGSLVPLDDLSDGARLKYTKNIEPPKPSDVGDIFLEELRKHHTIDVGFAIKKINNITINYQDSIVDCQLLQVTTPWESPSVFYVYSPTNESGFNKFAAAIRGPLALGKQGSIQNPQPFWSWDTRTIDGLETVPKNGPPVMVEYMGVSYIDYLAAFFKHDRFKP